MIVLTVVLGVAGTFAAKQRAVRRRSLPYQPIVVFPGELGRRQSPAPAPVAASGPPRQPATESTPVDQPPPEPVSEPPAMPPVRKPARPVNRSRDRTWEVKVPAKVELAADAAQPQGVGSPAAPAGSATASDARSTEAAEEESDTVVFRRPDQDPLQILPGRLEILEGEDAVRDVRFFRMPGEPAQITLGREGGPEYRHVIFRSPTVSRRHAQIEFADGNWTIANLSRTNPVEINGQELSVYQERRILHDGDRIELGEVVCRFRAR